MYPIHFAVLGRSIEVIKWLIDIRCVPLKSSKKKRNSSRDGTITTSKGRSVLDMAVASHDIDIVRYMVVEKNISILKYRDIGSALATLDNALRRITILSSSPIVGEEGKGQTANENVIRTCAPTGKADDITAESKGVEEDMEVERVLSESARAVEETCIICCSNPIDCVIIPCGHQICCLGCSSEIVDCPICCKKSSFLRTFRI